MFVPGKHTFPTDAHQMIDKAKPDLLYPPSIPQGPTQTFLWSLKQVSHPRKPAVAMGEQEKQNSTPVD